MSAPLGNWTWSSEDERLVIEIAKDPLRSLLNGIWSLEDFGRMTDGLSRRRLKDALEGGNPGVSCIIRLADGESIFLAGAFTSSADAIGMVLSVDRAVNDEDDGPGPELVSHFQPIVSLRTQKIVGFEALARWRVKGSISEDSGWDDGLALTTNMLLQSCAALETWARQLSRDDLFVQVNLTSRDLEQPTLVDLVKTLITGFSIAPGRLRLELTEQAALRDSSNAITTVRALQEEGAGFVLDDFGSGHSSFLWLAELPAQALKIDSALTAAADSERVQTILEAITLLARRLSMTSTAEGVESRSQISLLQRLGFDYAQGFALGRPMPLDEATDFLRTNK